MYMMTCPEAARELGMSVTVLRRRARRGEYPHMMLGDVLLVDVDAIRQQMAGEDAKNLVDVEQLSELTGLTMSAIRRGMREGWLSSQRDMRDSRRRVFDRNRALEEIAARLEGGR